MSRNYQRQRFVIKTDTGVAGSVTKGDTGPAFWGEITQVLYTHSDTGVADTGANFRISLVPVEGGDTGLGVNVLETLDLTAARRMFVPTQDIHTSAGASDTGAAPFYSAGDHLRIKMTAGRTLDPLHEQVIFVYVKS